MPRGIVKNWDSKSGRGAILCFDPNQPEEFFVDYSGIRSEFKTLLPGQEVIFSATRGKEGNVAIDVVQVG